MSEPYEYEDAQGNAIQFCINEFDEVCIIVYTGKLNLFNLGIDTKEFCKKLMAYAESEE